MPDARNVIDGLHDNATDVFIDSFRSLAGDDREGLIDVLISRVRAGELNALTLMEHGCPVGVICYRVNNGEAELHFGHVMGLFTGLESIFLSSAIDRLKKSGVSVIRTNFTWPAPKKFMDAAVVIGFKEVPRINMYLVPSGTMPVAPPGVDIVPWGDKYSESLCRIMSEAAGKEDRAVYPLFSSMDGARKLLAEILENRHGVFLPGLSFVAVKEDKVAGFILASSLADRSVLILDIAVDAGYVRNGIGSALIKSLIAAASGRPRVVLSVSAGNEAAIRLYERHGFNRELEYKRYVLLTGDNPSR